MNRDPLKAPVPKRTTRDKSHYARFMPDEKTPRCQGTSTRSGEQCGKAAMKGTSVCRTHGGAAPRTRRLAALRMAALVDPAIATLAREMTNQNGTPMSRLRAAENILDRAGYPRKVEADADTSRALLLQRISEVAEDARAEAEAEEQTPPPPAVVIEGEVE